MIFVKYLIVTIQKGGNEIIKRIWNIRSASLRGYISRSDKWYWPYPKVRDRDKRIKDGLGVDNIYSDGGVLEN